MQLKKELSVLDVYHKIKMLKQIIVWIVRGKMKLRSKIVEIEALLYTGDNLGPIWHEFGVEGIRDAGDHIVLTTLHGDEVPCRPGYWVVREPVPNRFYPCDPEVIERKYEVIDE